MSGEVPAPPALSVCIPAYNRPHLFQVAVGSVLAQIPPSETTVEVVVSDDSTDDATEQVFRRHLRGWGGKAAYHRNAPPLGMAGNWNRCVEAAAGRYVLLLHDDDFLLPGAVDAILETVQACDPRPEVLLFGVDVVGPDGERRRRQAARHRHYVHPQQALIELLGNSSFVRFPGMVVSRAAYQAAGPFDEAVGEVADVLMWARLVAAHGLWRVPAVTAAYRLHQEALTSRMWRPEVLWAARQLFDDDAVRGWLRARDRHRLRGRWMSQFVLAGAWRRVRAGDPAGALQALELLDGAWLSGADVPASRRAGRRALAAVAGAWRIPGTASRGRRPPDQRPAGSVGIER